VRPALVRTMGAGLRRARHRNFVVMVLVIALAVVLSYLIQAVIG